MNQSTNRYAVDLKAAEAAGTKDVTLKTPDDHMAVEAGRQIKKGKEFGAKTNDVTSIR